MEILYLDNEIIAINKPSGLMVHRSPLDTKANRFALQITRNLIQKKVYPIHRLDRPVSGVLLFALTPDIAQKMISLFSSRQIQKTYLAIMRGYIDDNGIIDYPLKSLPDRFNKPAPDSHPNLKPSITRYRRIATAEIPVAVGRYDSCRYSLARIHPETGRRHQIRRHLKHIFHPILGDTTYGDRHHNRYIRESWNCNRVLLSAMELSFIHPVNQKKITITARLDQTFNSILERLNWIEAIPGHWIYKEKSSSESTDLKA